MWRDWAIFEISWQRIRLQQKPKISVKFVAISKRITLCKRCCFYYLGNFWKHFNSSIWWQGLEMKCFRPSNGLPEDTYCRGKDHCVASLKFNKIGFDQRRKYVVICMYRSSWIQTCKTVGEPYSDTFHDSECSLVKGYSKTRGRFTYLYGQVTVSSQIEFKMLDKIYLSKNSHSH